MAPSRLGTVKKPQSRHVHLLAHSDSAEPREMAYIYIYIYTAHRLAQTLVPTVRREEIWKGIKTRGHIYTYTHIHSSIYIYIERERKRERERERF